MMRAYLGTIRSNTWLGGRRELGGEEGPVAEVRFGGFRFSSRPGLKKEVAKQ